MKKLTTLYLAVSIFSTIGLAQMTHAAVVLGTVQGYEASVSGSIPVFLVLSDHDAFAANSGEKAARIQSGFNPANVTFHVKAPTTDGLTVSAHPAGRCRHALRSTRKKSRIRRSGCCDEP